MELLPKSFTEFKHSLDSIGLSHARLLEAYAEYEAQRIEKLCVAKRERIKVKQAEQRLKWSNSTENPASKKEPSSSVRHSFDHCKHQMSCPNFLTNAAQLLPEKVCWSLALQQFTGPMLLFFSKDKRILITLQRHLTKKQLQTGAIFSDQENEVCGLSKVSFLVFSLPFTYFMVKGQPHKALNEK